MLLVLLSFLTLPSAVMAQEATPTAEPEIVAEVTAEPTIIEVVTVEVIEDESDVTPSIEATSEAKVLPSDIKETEELLDLMIMKDMSHGMPSHRIAYQGEECHGKSNSQWGKGNGSHSKKMQGHGKGEYSEKGGCPHKNKLMILVHKFIFGGMALLFLFIAPFVIRRGWALGALETKSLKSTAKTKVKPRTKKK